MGVDVDVGVGVGSKVQSSALTHVEDDCTDDEDPVFKILSL